MPRNERRRIEIIARSSGRPVLAYDPSRLQAQGNTQAKHVGRGKIHYVPYRTAQLIWSISSIHTFTMPGRKRTRKSRQDSSLKAVDASVDADASAKSEEQVRIDGWVALADTALKPSNDPDQGPQDQ